MNGDGSWRSEAASILDPRPFALPFVLPNVLHEAPAADHYRALSSTHLLHKLDC